VPALNAANPGSARVSRAGFGVSPKQSFEKFAKAGRFRQHARRVRYPDSAVTMQHMVSSRSTSWLHRFSFFTAIATLLLICSGGMVTSKGVGLAVPDWPTTFGYNMFLFPVSKWVGGILFEHTHRLIASAVGVLTIILSVWLWRIESRRWLRNLGFAALGAVILQGVLGGLRVTMLKDEIGIFHACLAQGFFAMLIVITLATSRLWQQISAQA